MKVSGIHDQDGVNKIEEEDKYEAEDNVAVSSKQDQYVDADEPYTKVMWVSDIHDDHVEIKELDNVVDSK